MLNIQTHLGLVDTSGSFNQTFNEFIIQTASKIFNKKRNWIWGKWSFIEKYNELICYTINISLEDLLCDNHKWFLEKSYSPITNPQITIWGSKDILITSWQNIIFMCKLFFLVKGSRHYQHVAFRLVYFKGKTEALFHQTYLYFLPRSQENYLFLWYNHISVSRKKFTEKNKKTAGKLGNQNYHQTRLPKFNCMPTSA